MLLPCRPGHREAERRLENGLRRAFSRLDKGRRPRLPPELRSSHLVCITCQVLIRDDLTAKTTGRRRRCSGHDMPAAHQFTGANAAAQCGRPGCPRHGRVSDQSGDRLFASCQPATAMPAAPRHGRSHASTKQSHQAKGRPAHRKAAGNASIAFPPDV